MTISEHPTINDLLARLYTTQHEAALRVRGEAKAITARHAAKGLLRSGATLQALTELIEKEFDAALAEMLATLRHMKTVPDIDYRACRDQAFLRARDLVPILRGACELEKWIDTIGRGSAGDIINKRVEALFPKIDYRLRQFDVGLDQVTAVQSAAASPPSDLTTTDSEDRGRHRFQVALSFAGEQRGYVREVAETLKTMRIKVFYDEFEANALWGKDGAEHFQQVFSEDTQYVVMFISADYVAKVWPRHERRAATSRQMKANAEFILPVRFDASEVPGLPDTLQYLSADRYSPAQLAMEIAKKIGAGSLPNKASDARGPASAEMTGALGLRTDHNSQPATAGHALEATLDLPEAGIVQMHADQADASRARSLTWRPTVVGAKSRMYLDVRSGVVEEVIAAVRAVGGVQSVELDRTGSSRSVVVIGLPASAEVVQRSIADRAIAAARQVDFTISFAH